LFIFAYEKLFDDVIITILSVRKDIYTCSLLGFYWKQFHYE